MGGRPLLVIQGENFSGQLDMQNYLVTVPLRLTRNGNKVTVDGVGEFPFA